jgi:hypothetical protein
MTDKKWTPGPWVVTGVEYDDVRIETLHPMPEASHAYGDQTIVGSSEWTYLEDANARLIAAAPDLYDALEAAEESIVAFAEDMGVYGYSGASDVLAQVRAAMAKARGES